MLLPRGLGRGRACDVRHGLEDLHRTASVKRDDPAAAREGVW